MNTQAQFATSYVSIQVMNGNSDWSVTVQNKIAAFKLDVFRSCPSPTLFLLAIYRKCLSTDIMLLHAFKLNTRIEKHGNMCIKTILSQNTIDKQKYLTAKSIIPSEIIQHKEIWFEIVVMY